MYGQLKSTVTCQDCGNISITFDPFLTLSLPIARPFKVKVFLAPLNIFKEEDERFSKQEVSIYSIALNKNSKITDLIEKASQLSGIDKNRLLVTNFNSRNGMIETRFKDTQSC